MKETFTLSWKEDRGPEEFSDQASLLSMLTQIASETTREAGVAVVIQKESGQEVIVIMAGKVGVRRAIRQYRIYKPLIINNKPP